MLLFTVIRPWTFIIVIDFQGGCVYQISTLELLISGLIPFLDFCPLIRAVEKLHPRYFFSGKLFWTSFGIFLTLSDHALISGQIQFQNFCPLIRAVEKFHPRHLYFSYSFYLSLKHFSCTSFIREARKIFLDQFGTIFFWPPNSFVWSKKSIHLAFCTHPYYFSWGNFRTTRFLQLHRLLQVRENSNEICQNVFYLKFFISFIMGKIGKSSLEQHSKSQLSISV